MVIEAEIEGNIHFGPSDIQKFFKGARIFITGGSGYLGNLLIQKLLRDCPDISKLYLLIRSKRGKTPEQRFEEMFEDSVFDRMKEEQPKFSEKIKLIIGDIEQPDLGLNEDYKKLITDQVNIIFHMAATVSLNGKLKKAVLINLRATRDLIEIAKTITNLKALVHVSTAYSHCHRFKINEQFYDVPMTPERLIQISELLNDDEINFLTTKLIGMWPNTYSFTKALAENIIQEHGKGLPIAIVRPSMVISTYKDPLKGWVNNSNGPVGISASVTLGLTHVIQLILDNECDMVPGDYVVNCFIAAAWYIGNSKNNSKNDSENKILNKPVIFNYTTSSENALTWRTFFGLTTSKGLKYKSIHVIWCYFLFFTKSDFTTKFFHILFHRIPAHTVDTILFVLGKKRRMLKIYKKIEDIAIVGRFFCVNEWKFGNDNTQELWQNLNNTDRQLFPFSMKELSWNDYFDFFIKGFRIYLLKDPIKTIPQARKKYQKLKLAHRFLISILSLITLTVVYKVFQIFL